MFGAFTISANLAPEGFAPAPIPKRKSAIQITRKRASLECFLALDPSPLLELDADRHLFRSHAIHHRDLFFDFGKIERLGGGRGYGGCDTVFFLLQRIE